MMTKHKVDPLKKSIILGNKNCQGSFIVEFALQLINQEMDFSAKTSIFYPGWQSYISVEEPNMRMGGLQESPNETF